jgi:Secretion system C-terminal sorting domain
MGIIFFVFLQPIHTLFITIQPHFVLLCKVFFFFLKNDFNLFLCMKKIFLIYVLLLVPHFLLSQIIDTTLIVDYSYCLGNSVQVHPVTPPQNGCAYHWTPSAGVSDSTIAEPVIQAAVTTFYQRMMVCGVDTMYDYAMITVKPAAVVSPLLPDCSFVCVDSCTRLHIIDIIPMQSWGWGGSLQQYGYTGYLWNTGVSDTAITACTEGFYSVVAVYGNGIDHFCDAFLGQSYLKIIQCDSTASIKENGNISAQIYPNPAKETLYVENITNGHWEIYNWVGKKVDSGEISWDCEISLRNLEQGLYILIIENNQKIQTSPFIKQ